MNPRKGIRHRAEKVGMFILLGVLTCGFIGMVSGCVAVVYDWVSQ